MVAVPVVTVTASVRLASIKTAPRRSPSRRRALPGRRPAMPDGTVGKARILRSLDRESGLDDAALAAARQWVFVPGKFNDEAVPVRVKMSLEFRLHFD